MQPFDWRSFLTRYRTSILDQWVLRLSSEVSEHYQKRPVDELRYTIGKAFEANFQALCFDRWEALDRFIDEICRLRLEGGFPLVDVQKAFDLFRLIAVPMIGRECEDAIPSRAIDELNRCLAYTIYFFSDHFQKLHRRHLLDYADRLREEVERKTAQLSESERKYKILVEEITDGYVVLQDGRIVFHNPAFAALHDDPDNALNGKLFIEFVAPEDQDALQSRLAHAAEHSQNAPAFEYLRLARSGKRFPTEIQLKSTRYENHWCQIGLCRDITERVELENRMREAERLAHIAHVATSLSHEIRNPLSAIKMNLQILQRHPDIVGNDKRRIDIAVQEMHRLEQILMEVLDFAKPVVLQKRPGNLNHVLMQTIDLLEPKFAEKSLAIHVCFDEKIPRISIDPEKIEQVAINLLLNAIDAAPQESALVIGTRRHSDTHNPQLCFWIENAGNDIPPDIREKLFQPFFTTKSKGGGLGLSVVRRLVEAHDGRIEIENRKEGGTIFTVILPAGAEHGCDTGCR
ncbi:two-component system sensor histidine kinase NtrB [Desulfatirhabdium butyrativorans]|uniref:two-component system sensor histidine kinase NtrB n=1 Tax=Desulfatirhabdium butyrativorans TaxID=340467 RepID=UPI00040F08A4|nr:ATP-binding protein [Desulfatirhabdium butyrativorans]